MREDQLSPRLGRLIDAAKVAAQEGDPHQHCAGSAAPPTDARRVAGAPAPADAAILSAEAVALLAGSDVVYAARGSMGLGECRAAAAALDAARAAGEYELLAAAVASGDMTAQDVVPCPTCRAALAAIDPDLDVVLKRRGRWVLVPLSSLPLGASSSLAPAPPEGAHR